MSRTVELKVRGMSCEHCNMRVEKALQKVDDVTKVKANYKKGVAVVTLDEDSSVSIDDLIKAVNDTEIYTAEKA